jgi:antitoxin MazE
MKTELIRIGNSRGVRIPKPLIEQVGFGDSVDLRVENGQIVLAKETSPRDGWEQAFRAAESTTRDPLLLKDAAPNDFDEKEWNW